MKRNAHGLRTVIRFPIVAAVAVIVFGGPVFVASAYGGSAELAKGLSEWSESRGTSGVTDSTEPGREPQTAAPTASPHQSSVDYARSLEEAFNQVADQVLPVVVEINVVEVVRQNIPRFQSPWQFFFAPPQFEEREFRRPGLGSGVIVRRDGRTVYVLSNNHVVGDADEISIRLHDGREFEGRIVGKDERTDLALLSFETREDVPVARLGDSDALDVGDWVLAVGNPFGFESTVTVGIVSALRRTPQPGANVADFTDYIQTDAAINPGNSGGALVDLDGRLLGVNSWIASQSGGSTGVGFAIPAAVVSRVVDDLIERGRVIYGWVGVTAMDVTGRQTPGLAAGLEVQDESGILINNVHQSGPAATDGLLPGDFVTQVNGNSVANFTQFARAIGSKSPGTNVDLSLIRYGNERTVTVTLDEQPPQEEMSNPSNLWPGLTVIPIADQIRSRLGIPSSVEGVIAISVIAGSPAATAGMQRGDIVEAVDGTETPNVIPFYRSLNEAGDAVPISVNRGGRQLQLTLRK